MELVCGGRPAVDVVFLNWPDEQERLERIRALGVPRLLLIGDTCSAPEPVDSLEDWIRLPARQEDFQARAATLSIRAQSLTAAPTVDREGLLRYRGRWVTLSPIEEALAAVLVERFGAVAGRDALAWRAWAESPHTRNALDVHMRRLRGRIAALGLEVRTVRGRGYLLQPAGANGAG